MYDRHCICFYEYHLSQFSIPNNLLQGNFVLPATSLPEVVTIEITLIPTNPAEDVTVDSITIHVCGEVAATTSLPSGTTTEEEIGNLEELSKYRCGSRCIEAFVESNECIVEI